MYHLDDDEYLSIPYYRKTRSICPECLQPIDADIYEEDDQIWMKKSCEDHGPFRDKLSSSAKYYKWTHWAIRDKDGKVLLIDATSIAISAMLMSSNQVILWNLP